MTTAWQILSDVEDAEEVLKKTAERLRRYADEVDEFESEVMTHAELKRALKKADEDLADEKERSRLLIADKVAIRRMIDEALDWDSEVRQTLGKKFKVDAAGTHGALKLFLKLYKKSLEKK